MYKYMILIKQIVCMIRYTKASFKSLNPMTQKKNAESNS